MFSTFYTIKSSSSDVVGYLPKENYSSYVAHLNNFFGLMKGKGIDIFVVSIQNELDISVLYESCDWTTAEMTDFLKIQGL
jgi:glucuronoarabinoxylan endo-1,4-beta-xylanase